VVHDRVEVESSILPRYFNHSSFASLRRQLNYFSFIRIGKGRQRGATYCNEGVVQLEDILSLKRRSVTSNNAAVAEAANVVSKSFEKEATENPSNVQDTGTSKATPKVQGNGKNPNKRMRLANNKAKSPIIASIPSLIQTTTPCNGGATMMLPPRVSPVDHFTGDGQLPPQRVSLDLTSSSTVTPGSMKGSTPAAAPLLSTIIYSGPYHLGPANPTMTTSVIGDDDVLAGCRALLCFSRGIPSR
jgi:HSF-type DNA-binding